MEKNPKMIKFERIAEKRVKETLRKISLIGNLANKSNYSYTDEHVKQIFRAVDAEVKAAKTCFSGKNDSDTEFGFNIK